MVIILAVTSLTFYFLAQLGKEISKSEETLFVLFAICTFLFLYFIGQYWYWYALWLFVFIPFVRGRKTIQKAFWLFPVLLSFLCLQGQVQYIGFSFFQFITLLSIVPLTLCLAVEIVDHKSWFKIKRPSPINLVLHFLTSLSLWIAISIVGGYLYVSRNISTIFTYELIINPFISISNITLAVFLSIVLIDYLWKTRRHED